MLQKPLIKTLAWVSQGLMGAELFRDLSRIDRFQIISTSDIQRACDAAGKNPIDAVVVHLPIRDASPAQILEELRGRLQGTPIVICDPSGTAGANFEWPQGDGCQYISTPLSPEELTELLIDATRQRNTNLDWSRSLIGSSDAMRQVTEIIRMVSPRRSTILITGETGSGKEVAARAIHIASNRAGSRMVAINCAALPDHLLEAELFGHTKGAFTGAVNARVGLFEQAHRGTIFLDEIGEMPLQLQSKLLRVLQEREIQRIGSSVPISVDARVIAASNIDLLEAVATRRFRQDLYYRLNVVALRMPPLRERVTDIPELVEHFLDRLVEDDFGQRKQLSSEALNTLLRYSWPGNVRQLEHALESAVALSGARTILHPGDFDLPPEMRSSEMARLSALDVPESGINFEELMMGIERRLLERALAKSGGNKARAASMLNMKRTTLISKFKSLDVCA